MLAAKQAFISHLSGEQERGAHEEADGATAKADAIDDGVLVHGLNRVDGREPVQLEARQAVQHCTDKSP